MAEQYEFRVELKYEELRQRVLEVVQFFRK